MIGVSDDDDFSIAPEDLADELRKRRRAYRQGWQHAMEEVRQATTVGLTFQEQSPTFSYVEVQMDKQLYRQLFPHREVVEHGEVEPVEPGDRPEARDRP